MNFGFNEEQNMLRDQVVRFMQEACPMTKVRDMVAHGDGFDGELWQQMAELGWLGLNLDETYGGLGLKWIDLCIVLEECGAGLSSLPLLSHALSAAAIDLCGDEVQKGQWLPLLAGGTTKFAIGLYDEPNWVAADAVTAHAKRTTDNIQLSGVKPFVTDALSADHLLLAVQFEEALALAIVARDKVNVVAQPTMDQTKPTACVTLDDIQISRDHLLPMTPEQLNTLNNYGAVACCAEMVGAANAILQLTSNYAKERIQFGKPIGQYQGVKHNLAEMYVDVESFRSLCYYAAWTLDDAPEECDRAVSLAKGYASDAFAQIGIDGVGLHGAIGFTAEYDAQLYLKRSKWARTAFGDSDYHLERVAALGGL